MLPKHIITMANAAISIPMLIWITTSSTFSKSANPMDCRNSFVEFFFDGFFFIIAQVPGKCNFKNCHLTNHKFYANL